MNELSPAAMQQALAQQSEIPLLSFLRIEHASLDAPLRYVFNYQSIVRADGTYMPLSFNAPPPGQEDGKLPETNLTLDNTDLAVGAILRTLIGAPTVTLFSALATTPDVIEEGPFRLTLNAVTGDISTLSGALGMDRSVLGQVIPADNYMPSNSPGMFR